MDRFLVRSESTGNLNSKRPGEDISGPWQFAKRPAVSRNSEKFDEARKLPLHNQFNDLTVDDNSEQSKNNFYRDASTGVKKNGHIPPLILEIQKDWTHETIKNLISRYTNKFHLQYRANNKVSVSCHTTECHQLLKEGLRKENAAFLTYTRKDEKVPKMVIKGLPSYVQDELPAELEKLGFPGASVSQMKTQIVSTLSCPPFLVVLPAGADMAKFRNIKYLFNCVVTIQKFTPIKTAGTQCYRCQSFGHASRNCNMPARCVKCTEPHATRECPKKDRLKPARCCNCDQNHPANYHKCETRLAYLQRTQARRERQSRPLHAAVQYEAVPPTILPPSSKKLSYAATVKTHTSHNSAHNEQLNLPPDDPSTKEMLEILTCVKNLKPQFSACESMLDKVMLILTHLGHYV